MSVASHELRTPLGNILGYATLLYEDAGEEIRPLAESILSASSKLRAVLDDIANMNLLYAGKADLELSSTTLQQVISYARQEVEHAVRQEDYELEYRLPADPLPIVVDLPKMSVVFVNLLLNAVRFTPKQGKIVLEAREYQDRVEVEVRDTGRGIKTENLEKIFEVFFQEEEHMIRRVGGLGLGLSIARELVELHGGELWAESEGRGQGATFTVSLSKEPPGTG